MVNTSYENHHAYHMISQEEFEPQRNSNFEVQIEGLSNIVPNAMDTIRLSVSSSAVPSFAHEVLRIPRGNTEVKYAGKVVYKDIDIAFNDYIGKDVENIVHEWQKLTFDPQTGKLNKSTKYKMTGYLIEYSPDYTTARVWQLTGCWLNDVDFGAYDANNHDIRQIKGMIVYDNAYRID